MENSWVVMDPMIGMKRVLSLIFLITNKKLVCWLHPITSMLLGFRKTKYLIVWVAEEMPQEILDPQEAKELHNLIWLDLIIPMNGQKK